MRAFPLYLLLLLALLGCCREDDPKASDPQPLGPVSAAFNMKRAMPINSGGSTHWIEYQSDSFVVPYSIRFEVIDRTADSVFW